jgi:hypothetical protein
VDDKHATTSRRNVLKAGGAAAASAATFFAGAAALSQTADAAIEPHVAGHVPTSIVMEVAGTKVTHIRSASQAGSSVSVAATQNGDGTVTFNRGVSNGVTLSVTRNQDSDTTFRTWFAGKASSTGGATEAIQQTVVLTLLGRNNSKISTLTLTNAWPTSWGVGSWTVPETQAIQLTERVTLLAESATFD